LAGRGEDSESDQLERPGRSPWWRRPKAPNAHQLSSSGYLAYGYEPRAPASSKPHETSRRLSYPGQHVRQAARVCRAEHPTIVEALAHRAARFAQAPSFFFSDRADRRAEERGDGRQRMLNHLTRKPSLRPRARNIFLLAAGGALAASPARAPSERGPTVAGSTGLWRPTGASHFPTEPGFCFPRSRDRSPPWKSEFVAAL